LEQKIELRTSVVLAGGKSRRFGQNKALYPFSETTIIGHIISKLRLVSDEIIIVSNDYDQYEGFGLRIIEDVPSFKGMGPLAGLYSALINISASRLFLLACDMPLIDDVLIDYLWKIKTGLPAVIPFCNNKLQPLFAIYNKTLADKIFDKLKHGSFSMNAFISEVDFYVVKEEEIKYNCKEKNPFYNINTMDDLRFLEQEIQ
jgi:molybdopterin-guanine dinucleotide biosynthesis protein A